MRVSGTFNPIPSCVLAAINSAMISSAKRIESVIINLLHDRLCK
jgi:hypothetical protein